MGPGFRRGERLYCELALRVKSSAMRQIGLAALLLASCATDASLPATYAGNEEAMLAMARAAMACGYPSVKISRNAQFTIDADTILTLNSEAVPRQQRGTALMCLKAWTDATPFEFSYVITTR